ncbi:MAG TPA: hypothetical protein VNN18_03760 [Candidatus Xenobia bacterium]|nr:hypothetical protein [Candidatus Xenobia bacterium]
MSEFNKDVYGKIGYDELLMYCALRLAEETAEITFERMVATAFEFFPERFSLRGYPHWPDSALVNKSWLRCRTDKGYLVGSVKDGFKLTPKGQAVGERIRDVLSGRRRQFGGRTIPAERRTREGRFLRSIEDSSAYKHYKSEGNLESVTDFDFCDMLLCTLDVPAKTLKGNLETFRQAAQIYARNDILEFLKACEERFRHLLATPKPEGYTGGMFKRKQRRGGRV